MTKYKKQSFSKTFKNARKGLRIVLKSERNVRIHFLAGVLALLAGVILELSRVELCVVFIAICLVVGFEMLNSAIEFSLDAVFKNRYSILVGMAKDISAGAVMFATFIAIIIGAIIYIPAMVNFLVK